MSAAEELREFWSPECHEEIPASGMWRAQPCESEAVAMRFDMGEGQGAPYPVCIRHVRPPMVPLSAYLA